MARTNLPPPTGTRCLSIYIVLALLSILVLAQAVFGRGFPPAAKTDLSGTGAMRSERITEANVDTYWSDRFGFPAPGVHGTVYASVVDKQRNLYIGGRFSHVGGIFSRECRQMGRDLLVGSRVGGGRGLAGEN